MDAKLGPSLCRGRDRRRLIAVATCDDQQRRRGQLRKNAEAGYPASAHIGSSESHGYPPQLDAFVMQGFAWRSMFGIGNSNPGSFTADLKFGSVVHSFTFLPNR